MRPITFSCSAYLDIPAERIAEQILDLDRWPGFRGYGPLPGIGSAVFEARTAEVVGSRIRVANTDGSSHVEKVVEWEPDRHLRLRMGEFSAPLYRLATAFDETWEFEQKGVVTRVVRTFELHPKGTATRPMLWLISLLLRKAVARHLRQIREDAARHGHGAERSAPNREAGRG